MAVCGESGASHLLAGDGLTYAAVENTRRTRREREKRIERRLAQLEELGCERSRQTPHDRSKLLPRRAAGRYRARPGLAPPGAVNALPDVTGVAQCNRATGRREVERVLQRLFLHRPRKHGRQH